MTFDPDYRNTPRAQYSSFLERFLANLPVPRKLGLLIWIMLIGLAGMLVAALQGMGQLYVQQRFVFQRINEPIIALNNADLAMDELRVALNLLQDASLAPEAQLERKTAIAGAEQTVALALETYATDWLPPAELTLDRGVALNRREAMQQSLDALEERETVLFDQLQNEHSVFQKEMESFYRELDAGGAPSAERAIQSISVMQSLARKLLFIHNERQKIADEALRAMYPGFIGRVLLALTLAVIFLSVFASAIGRSINSRLITLSNNALALEDNLLDRHSTILIAGRDEIAVVSRSFDTMSARLRQSFAELEDKVRERTANLAAATAESERRARQFEAITKVSQAINATQDLRDLLPRIAEVISRQFDFYHVGIFLNDPDGQYTVLRAANSEGGKRMLARHHKLRIGEQGIVGYVTGSGNPRVALDVGADAAFFNNPDMPNTHSEMALPLAIGGKTIGALDVQSDETNAFTEDDIEVLATLADQVSLAIQNAQIYNQLQRSLAEAEAISRRYFSAAWNRIAQDEGVTGFRYVSGETLPLDLHGGEQLSGEAEDERKTVSVPILVRGQSVGRLSVRVPKHERIKSDQMDLIQAVAERVALFAENARLFDETTRRAERERLVSNITARIRGTNDPREMIQTAVQELQQALNVSRIEIIPQKPAARSDR